MILVAISKPLLPQILPESLLDELRSLAVVSVAPSPTDLTAVENRALLADADVLVTGRGTSPVDAAVMAVAPRLRAVVHTAGSVRPVVTRDVYARGVVVSSQAWANALPVAEYTVAAVLWAAKGVFRAQRTYRALRGHLDVQAELEVMGTYGSRVGIIGASTIGRRVIELLAPFDLEIALFDPTVSAGEGHSLGATPMSLDELMRTSQVVSLHAPWLPSTGGMIGAGELAALPDGATFINTARGALVDEAALVSELQSGRIDAVLDVTWPEPPPAESPFWTLPNVLLTPHVAGSAGNELARMGASAVREVARVLRGEPLHHGVDADAFERLA